MVLGLRYGAQILTCHRPRGCGAARLQEALEDRPRTLSPADLALPAQEMVGTDSQATRLGRVPGKHLECIHFKYRQR